MNSVKLLWTTLLHFCFLILLVETYNCSKKLRPYYASRHEPPVPFLYDSESGEFQDVKVSRDFRTSFKPEKKSAHYSNLEYLYHILQTMKKFRTVGDDCNYRSQETQENSKQHRIFNENEGFVSEPRKQQMSRSVAVDMVRKLLEEIGGPSANNATHSAVQDVREKQGKIMMSYIKKSVDPCKDFYEYACGNWHKQHPIPKDKSVYDSFEIVRDSLDALLHKLLTQAEQIGPRISKREVLQQDAIVKAKAFYKSCMDHDILIKRGNKPLLSLLESFGGWPIIQKKWDESNFNWIKLTARLRLYNNQILISHWIGTDIKSSDNYVIQFDQTNLGLQSKDYFLDPAHSRDLEAYKNFITSVAVLLGASSLKAANEAKEIVNFERKLAMITTSQKVRYNITALYHKMSVKELINEVPKIDWWTYLTTVLLKPITVSEPVIIYDIGYMKRLEQLMKETSPRTAANYLLWRFVRHRINNLDDRFQQARQKFLSVLYGREEIPERWKTCVSYVNDNMGMAVGALYVRHNFDERSKEDTLRLAEEIRLAFRNILNKNKWIDSETKKLAESKVDAMSLKIGYPNFILDTYQLNKRYNRVNIHPERFFENVLSILKNVAREEFNRLGTKVNKNAWSVEPALINAYYSRDRNQLTGILQPPFYHRHFTRNLNYGGIGTVIGHEITHGFDDKGRLFDKHGNLHEWWTRESIEAFNKHAQCIIDQYSKYTLPEVSMNIDGIVTQGENIADNGGIKQSYWAYNHWLKQHGKEEEETLKNVPATPRQLFFLSFAQMWCGTSRPEMTRSTLKTTVHSPGKFRVIGTLSNLNEFSTTFNCPKGSPMNPNKKCELW